VSSTGSQGPPSGPPPAPTPGSPRGDPGVVVSGVVAEHDRRHARWVIERDDATRSAARLSSARLIVFFVTLLGGVAVIKTVPAHAPWLLVGVVAFAVLVVRHGRACVRRELSRRAVDVHARAQRRLADDWAGDGHDGRDLFPEEHLAASDIDLVGQGSLFQLLATGRSPLGEARLASWLATPAPPAEVSERQQSVAELAPDLDLFEEVLLLDPDDTAQGDPAELLPWAQGAPANLPSWEQPVAWVLVGLALASAGLWAFDVTSFGPLGLVAAVQALVGRIWARRHGELTHGAQTATATLPVLIGLLTRLESHPARSPGLARLVKSVHTPEGPPSEALETLRRIVGALEDATRNPYWAPVAFLLQRRVFLTHRLHAWIVRVRPSLPAWIDAAAEFEALLCLGTYAREHAEQPFPEVVEGAPRLEAVALRHPLLPRDRAVANDLTLGGEQRLLLVSGSNMSGKTTWLRSLGTNVVLAQAGAPVAATSLTITPLTVGASIRLADSLMDGVSKFYAEVKRLAALDQLAQEREGTLLMLDEIMSGTNSADRLVGARAYVQSLLSRGGLVLVTTHDLALTAIAEGLGSAGRNVHFAEDVDGDEMRFDYTLREGVVDHGNALQLMRSLGLDV
jgi:hypothetical protein